MELLRPISALLISAAPNAAGHGRCRLLAGQSAATTETAVHLTRLTTRGCLIADCPAAPAEGAQTWLKLPGRPAVGIGIEPGPDGALACAFVHPLHPAEVEAPLAPGPPEPRWHDRPKARCTLF